MGDVVLTKEARVSYVLTQSGAPFIEGGRAAWRGDAGGSRGRQIKHVGNEVGLKTPVTLCSDVEASTQYIRLTLDAESHERASALIRLHLGPVADKPDLLKTQKPAHREKTEQLLGKLRQNRDEPGGDAGAEGCAARGSQGHGQAAGQYPEPHACRCGDSGPAGAFRAGCPSGGAGPRWR